MTRGNTFSRVQGLKPGRSVFDLSYAKKMSGMMGYLYPMMCDEVVPGDVFDIGAEAVVRFAPMVAPVLHEIIIKADWFFVPYRILGSKTAYGNDGMTNWESFITGGRSGNSAVTRSNLGVLDMTTPVPEGGLWDHLGIPTGITLATAADDDAPLKFPGMSYLKIYNDYYRDPNLEDEVDITACPANAGLKLANWDADYFTRALPWQQRGTAPALPVTGYSSANFAANAHFITGSSANTLTIDNVNNYLLSSIAAGVPALKTALSDNVVDLSSATSVNIADLRLAVQLQRWMERNARSGARYTEFLRSHFGVAPRDDRLDRPEYIGGIRQPIVVSEVLQTSKTESGAPQGNLAGHGLMAGRHRVGRYHVQEYGLIMCLMSVIPRPAYQQGIDRQWLRKTRYDFYHPEFANLSEQAVQNEELYLSAAKATNLGIWGYQGRYDEMRSKRDKVAGAFRSSLNYWHLGRIFGSLPALSSTFGHVDPTSLTRIFAVPSADNIYVHWGNSIRAIRPLPIQSNPGLLDHDFGGV